MDLARAQQRREARRQIDAALSKLSPDEIRLVLEDLLVDMDVTFATDEKHVVGESVSTERWRDVHENDRRSQATVEEYKAGAHWFDRLAVGQRECIELRIAGKWPHEIAAILGKTIGAVHNRLDKGRKQLAKFRAREAAWIARETTEPNPVGCPFSGGGVKRMPKGKFRWNFRIDGDGHYGPTVATEEEAHAGLWAKLQELAPLHPKIARYVKDIAELLGDDAPPPAAAGPTPLHATPSPALRCSKCGESGHFATVCPTIVPPMDADAVDDCSSFPASTEAPKEEQSTATSAKTYRCGKCGTAGHNARRCTGPAAVRAHGARGEIVQESDTRDQNTTSFAPSAEATARATLPPAPAARLFVIAEDFEEEDGTVWIEGDVWEALEPTGETVEDHAQWTMRRQGDGVEGVGFPSLHPFVPHDPRAAARPLHEVTIHRVGMGNRKGTATDDIPAPAESA